MLLAPSCVTQVLLPAGSKINVLLKKSEKEAFTGDVDYPKTDFW
jgi:hypothetical protein